LPDGVTQRQERRVCDDGTVGPLTWRNVITMADLIAGSSESVRRQIPTPSLAINPAPELGGFVNLGMWLAVTEPAPISVTATAGSVWATTSAELESTTFDMGDGTVVVCDGAGDRIPASQMDSLGPSPICGHTYAGVNGREPFVVTMTSTWRVSWTGSGGAGGDLGGLDRTSSLEYEVLEIQTVGN
jgi:hypothetical protein